MGILQIRDAHRHGAKVLIGLTGAQGSGKTYGAIQFGFGLAGKKGSKLGVLDTENKRASLLSDILPDGQRFKIADLEPPFSPDRYIKAVKEFEAAGVSVLIIDSISHEYEGEGGVSDIAETHNKKWIAAKAEHKKFMNALLYSNLDVIACVRAREKVKVVEYTDKDGRKKQDFVPQGFQPISEKNFWFECTIGMMLSDAGRKREYLKQLPVEFLPFLSKTDGYLTADDGYALRQWLDSGGKVDHDAGVARINLCIAAEGGMKSLKEAWEALPAETRKKINPSGGCPDDLKTLAAGYDSQQEGAGADIAAE